MQGHTSIEAAIASHVPLLICSTMQSSSLHHRRKCSSTPKVLMTVLGLIAGLSICISLVFWAIGAPLILPFALIESLLLLAAFVCHAKSVCNFNEITSNES
jgi:uncharacterized membrane protein